MELAAVNVASSSNSSIKQESDNQSDHENVSDCESFVSGSNRTLQHHVFDKSFVRLTEGERVHDFIRRKFVWGLGTIGANTEVIAIHRNSYSTVMAQARIQSFQVYARAEENRRGGNANVKYAWYGTAGKEEIGAIISHGFGYVREYHNHGLSPCGIYLSPDDSPLESVKSSRVDEKGIRYLILCRVILGKLEIVHPGSEQCHPSSEEYDSGVDSLSSPKKYIVWCTRMNTHVLPECIVSFKVHFMKGLAKFDETSKIPTSPWLPFPTLISVLSQFLPSPAVSLISNLYKDHKESKISRPELVQKVRQIAGDKLLFAVIKSCRAKKVRGKFH